MAQVTSIFSPVGNVYNMASSASPEAWDDETLEAIDQSKQEMRSKLDQLALYIRELYYAFDGSATRKKILKIIEDSRKAYYMDIQQTNFPWPQASNIISPLTTMGVDEVEPRLVAAVIGREPYIKAKYTLGGGRNKEEAEAITKFDNYVLEHKVRVKDFVPQSIHEMLIDGTIYPLVSWETKEKKVRRLAPDPQSPDGLSKRITTVVNSGPRIELVPMEFVWHADDINDEDWEQADVIRYIGNMTIGEIKKRSQNEYGWILPNNWQKFAASSITLKTTQQKTEGVQDYVYIYEENQKPIEFLEAFVKFPLFGDESLDLIVLVEYQTFTVFRVREQMEVVDENIKPIRRMRFLKRRGVSWGYPLYTLIAGIQLGLDAMWNRCINSADITMTPWGFIKRGISGLLQSKIQVYPGNLIEVDNPEAINFPNLTGFKPQEFVPLILQYVSFFERTLNVTDYMQGRESQLVGKKGTTATGTLAVLQEGKIKHEYRGGLTHNEYLEFFKYIHDLCVSNMPIEEHQKIAGRPMLHYSSSEDISFLLVGSDLTSNRFVDRQETESFVATMQPFINLLNPYTLIDDILNSYEKEKQDYIDPELNQLIQAFLMQRQNEKEMVAMGIPEQVAKGAAAQGISADTARTFLKQMGKSAAQEAAGGESEGAA
jgi:hypothetical protein